MHNVKIEVMRILKDIKSELFDLHGLSQEDFENSGLDWDDLQAIAEDHESRMPQLVKAGNYVAETLREASEIHSIRVRVKDPYHLAAKIIRKANPSRVITLENYREQITDLIGVRGLHLYKEQWPNIHDFIVDRWTSKETTANVRPGDPEAWQQTFRDKNCEVRERTEEEGCYRSVHYIIESSPHKRELNLIEVQVRTIFEEAWGEIDHIVNYPQRAKNALLKNNLTILNRIAGLGDELGSFSFNLHEYLNEVAKNVRELEKENEERQALLQETESERVKLENEKQELYSDLESVVEDSKASKEEKKLMMNKIKELEKKVSQYEKVLHPYKSMAEDNARLMARMRAAMNITSPADDMRKINEQSLAIIKQMKGNQVRNAQVIRDMGSFIDISPSSGAKQFKMDVIQPTSRSEKQNDEDDIS